MAKDTCCRSRTHKTASQLEPSCCRYRPTVVIRISSHPEKIKIKLSIRYPFIYSPNQSFQRNATKCDAHFMHFFFFFIFSKLHFGRKTHWDYDGFCIIFFFLLFTLGGGGHFRILLQLPPVDYNHDYITIVNIFNNVNFTRLLQ